MFGIFNKAVGNYETEIYSFKIETINGQELDFSKFKDKVILIVNVASKCGFTNQYDGLQKLWSKYKKDGLVVVGFPSNQFGGQEPGSSKDIKDFCETNFNINFPMSKKVNVKGNDANSIYKWAKKNYGASAVPKWNFYKILIDKNGKIFKSYNSMTKPLSKKLIKDIENILY